MALHDAHVYLIRTVHLVLWLILVVSVTRFFVLGVGIVEGRSMEPAFVEDEVFLVSKWEYLLRPPRRAEVIQFFDPQRPDILLVKRVVGLPGETIVLRPDGVYVRTLAGERRLAEEYLSPGSVSLGAGASSRPIRVPRHAYVVLGDNRSVSYDSRFFGPVPRSLIKGRVVRSALGRLLPTAAAHGTGAPPVPQPGSPADGSALNVAQPTFAWSVSPDPDSDTVVSKIQLSTDPDFDDNVTEQDFLASPTFTASSPLADGIWFWRVRAKDEHGNFSRYSKPFTFTLDATPPPPPTASPSGGTYAPGLAITLSAEAGATIRYTTDGSTPTAASSLYDGPLRPTEARTVLRAVAIDAAGNASGVLSETYLVAATSAGASPGGQSDGGGAGEEVSSSPVRSGSVRGARLSRSSGARAPRVAAAATVRTTRSLLSSVNRLFRIVHGRNPTKREWEYWARRVLAGEKRTEPALLGAMRWQARYVRR